MVKGNKSEELRSLEDAAWAEASGEFDEEILADLISRGLSGEELLEEFKKTRHKVKPAVEEMLEDAKHAAEGKIKSYSYDDIFCAEDNSSPTCCKIS